MTLESSLQLLAIITQAIGIPIAILTALLAVLKHRLEQRQAAATTKRHPLLQLRRDPLAPLVSTRRRAWRRYGLTTFLGLLWGTGSIFYAFATLTQGLTRPFNWWNVVALLAFPLMMLYLCCSGWAAYRTLRMLIAHRGKAETSACRRAHVVIVATYEETLSRCVQALRASDVAILRIKTQPDRQHGFIVGILEDHTAVSEKYFADTVHVWVDQLDDEACSVKVQSDGIRPTFKNDTKRNYATVDAFLRRLEE